MKALVPVELIERKLLLIRGKKVMLDADLAGLYGVEVKQLKRQVRRNIGRFPADFMIQLSKEEYESLRRHFGALKRGEHSKYMPYAFTEQGVAMLSCVLNSERAVKPQMPNWRVNSTLLKRNTICSSKSSLTQSGN